ncbi:hypothetical protein [Larkinella ripae]
MRELQSEKHLSPWVAGINQSIRKITGLALVDSGHKETIPRFSNQGLTVPIYIYAVIVSSFCVAMGIVWDIMWHMSIGRDGLLAPPHMLIYVGAIVSGLFSAYQILNLTLTKNHPGRAASVPFWGVFYGPLGAMFCVWGALAMLTSAPFDDWWHNTYGLDVQILTPPHTLLLTGIMTVQFGAMVSVLALQNQYRNLISIKDSNSYRQAMCLKWLFAFAAGILLVMLHTIISELISMRQSHNSIFYTTCAIILPIYLLAVGRASMLRWPMVSIAGIYMLGMLLPSWIIQNFPATPMLGPVLNPITHFQPFVFPLMLVIPALVLDWLTHRFSALASGKYKWQEWFQATVYGLAFMLTLLLVQWPFGEFLVVSPYAQNGFFLSYSLPYSISPDWGQERRIVFMNKTTFFTTNFLLRFGVALIYAILSARVGLLWGNWMKRIVR